MSTPRHIRRFWLWVGIALLVELAAITLCKRWHWFFPSRAVSEVYTRYAGTEGLDVSFVKDYRVNDSVNVDVTIIKATTDSSWSILIHDFNLFLPPPEMIQNPGGNYLEIWSAPKRDYSLQMDTTPLANDVIAMLWAERKVSVFHIETMLQRQAVKDNQIEEMISISKTSKNKHNEQNN